MVPWSLAPSQSGCSTTLPKKVKGLLSEFASGSPTASTAKPKNFYLKIAQAGRRPKSAGGEGLKPVFAQSSKAEKAKAIAEYRARRPLTTWPRNAGPRRTDALFDNGPAQLPD